VSAAGINLTRVGACSCAGVGPAQNSDAGVEQPYCPLGFASHNLWSCAAARSVLATGAIGYDVAVAARVRAFAEDGTFYGLASWDGESVACLRRREPGARERKSERRIVRDDA